MVDDPSLREGLSVDDARRRLDSVGPNEIEPQSSSSPYRRLLAQFHSPVVWLLVIAAGIAALLAEWTDAGVIATILVLNATVGWAQERRAEQAIAALSSLTAPRARVRRNGRSMIIAAREVVPGDLLLIESGDIVAADARLIEAHALSVNEAILTGESMPTRKTAGPIASGAALIDRHDTLFMGTAIATGTGTARVEATGRTTEIGKVADLVASIEPSQTPLQVRLEALSRTLALACAVIVLVVALSQWLQDMPLFDVFLSAVSLAVAAVPEGLPVVVTIALAIGVQRMAARHVLVRRLAAVETLGCATVICTDKTGTLTTGTMAVREIWGAEPDRVLEAAVACCDAELDPHGSSGTGDPTELAILAAGVTRGIHKTDLERTRRRVRVTPFDPDARFMAISRDDGLTYVKGALDALAIRIRADVTAATQAQTEMAARGLRVLAIATSDSHDGHCDLLGLIGLADPPRSEAIQAVADARDAGITTVMITGDHPSTAYAIARELGLVQRSESIDDRVHARATPSEKLDIVRAWKRRGAIVAMTGDGVNDAPALREAHIGIAMGRNGTEVARAAADLVLADDNFASIIAAVQEGRGIFENIRKTVVYLLTGNVAEILVMFVAALSGLPLPLLPIHLLWINVITDSLPALALVMDPASHDLLRQAPRPTSEPLVGRPEAARIGLTALLEATVTLAAFVLTLRSTDLAVARAFTFSVLVFSELFRAFAARSTRRTFWRVGALSNLRLVAVVAVSAILQCALVAWPASRSLFGLADMNMQQMAFAMAIGLLPVSALEVLKMVSAAIGVRLR